MTKKTDQIDDVTAPVAAPKKRIGTFDDKMRLVGFVEVPADHVGGVEYGDLPTNGSYIWDEPNGTFRPVGLGLPKVKNGVPPYSTEYVLSRMIEAVAALAPDALPGPVLEWKAWFDADLRKREEERKG